MQEFLLSEDLNEVCSCIKELEVPHFHHEIVKRGMVSVAVVVGWYLVMGLLLCVSSTLRMYAHTPSLGRLSWCPRVCTCLCPTVAS